MNEPVMDPGVLIAKLILTAKAFLAEMGEMNKDQVFKVFPETGGHTFEAYGNLSKAVEVVDQFKAF